MTWKMKNEAEEERQEEEEENAILASDVQLQRTGRFKSPVAQNVRNFSGLNRTSLFSPYIIAILNRNFLFQQPNEAFFWGPHF